MYQFPITNYLEQISPNRLEFFRVIRFEYEHFIKRKKSLQ